MKRIGGIFLKGLLAVLPAVVTLYLLYWLGATAEAVLGGLARVVLPEGWYVTGLGLLMGVGTIFGVGVLLNVYLLQRLWTGTERLLLRVPVVKTIYGAVQDLLTFVSKAEATGDQVVTVQVPGTDYRLLGVVTRRDWKGLPAGLGGADTVAVYTPMSYQVGGYTLLVPRSAVTPVEMGVEDAMRFAVTAGMSAGRTHSEGTHSEA